MCWYYGKSLTDTMRNSSTAPPPPLGMVNAVWGGTMIEHWVPNGEQSKCATWHSSGGALQPYDGPPRITPSCAGCTVNASSGGCNMSTHPQNCAGNGALFNGNIAPLANTSIKGMVWCEWLRAIATVTAMPDCRMCAPDVPAADQGENNAGGDAGSSIQNTGCE